MMLGLTVLLIGCARGSSDVCIRVIDYTPEQQLAVAGELENLSDNSLIPKFMDNYAVLRAKARATCNGS